MRGRRSKSGDVDRVVDHKRAFRAAGPRSHADVARGGGDADDRGCQPSQPALDPQVEAPREAAVRRERPAVDGEDADGYAGKRGGEPAESAGLRAVSVHDVRPEAAAEPHELEQC